MQTTSSDPSQADSLQAGALALRSARTAHLHSMSVLPPDLAAALAANYRLDRELGSGGMATVYLAEDLKHQRKVAVKVLRPELAATLGPDRFNQEILIAAQLSHPHILPVLDSGQAGGFLYYVMPLVEGESLRDRISRSGELPIADAVRILAEVTDALAYAHGRGVVHRDIKPDNVMITGRHALVMDFGVAKAIAESNRPEGAVGPRDLSALTTAGMALGTPAYMSPEQAAADPTIDHRADIYALGAMGYEMLTGEPPFAGRTPQAILAAQVTQAPEPIERRRTGIPGPLAIAVMRCLEKRPADRYQTAEALLAVLEPMGTPSGGTTPTQTTAHHSVSRWYGHPLRVGGMFIVAAVALLGAIYFFTIQLGLPDWVLRGGLALLVVGLPIMVLTGLAERRRAVASATGISPSGGETGINRMMTWKTALTGGGMAFGALALMTAAYTAMRLLGIGPVGTLMASGHLKASDRLIVADFANRSSDSTLGPSITEAFRIDLAQSPLVSLMGTAAMADALGRMQQPRSQPITPELGRELAQREGAKAVVVGDISPVGKGFVLTARLVAAQDGADLVALRETAADDGQLLKAIDRLSKGMRERIGESLKTIRASDPLEQVTTSSLDALRRYTEGVHLPSIGEFDRSIAQLKQAVAIDSGFAMAWRKLAVALNNSSGSTAEAVTAATRAYDHRDRLPALERYQTTAYYFWKVDFRLDQAISAYRSVLGINPNDLPATINLANILTSRRQYAEAESLASHAVSISSVAPGYEVLLKALLADGKIPEARAVVDRMAVAMRESPAAPFARGEFFGAIGKFDSAAIAFRSIETKTQDTGARMTMLVYLSATAQLQGQFKASEQYVHEGLALADQRGIANVSLLFFAGLGLNQALFRHDPAGGVRLIEAGLKAHPLSAMPVADRPYTMVAADLAMAGDPVQARRLMAEFESLVPEGLRRQDVARLWAQAWIAMAEGRPGEARPLFQQMRDERGCTNCGLFGIAQSYEQLKQPDSAIVNYVRSLELPHGTGSLFDRALEDIRARRRLGELYEARGDKGRALEYYGQFVAQWKDADPEFQPQVKEVQGRMARLAGEK